MPLVLALNKDISLSQPPSKKRYCLIRFVATDLRILMMIKDYISYDKRALRAINLILIAYKYYTNCILRYLLC